MNRTVQLFCQHVIDHAMALDQRFANKRFSLNFDPEMGFPFRPGTGVAGMKM